MAIAMGRGNFWAIISLGNDPLNSRKIFTLIEVDCSMDAELAFRRQESDNFKLLKICNPEENKFLDYISSRSMEFYNLMVALNGYPNCEHFKLV